MEQMLNILPFLVILSLLDLDPEYASLIRIRTQGVVTLMQIHADQDSKHGNNLCSVTDLDPLQLDFKALQSDAKLITPVLLATTWKLL